MCYYDKNGNDNTKYPNPNIEKETNYISADIYIKEENVGEEIRIINSFDGNENEIKNNCTIKINDEIIGFKYLYTFEKKGTYTIKYIFKKGYRRYSLYVP